MRHHCGWCQHASDWIDRVTTKCEHCTPTDGPDPSFVHCQAADGVIADRRGRALRDKLRTDPDQVRADGL